MTRMPGAMEPGTSAPTETTSPANSMPTMVPAPPTLPCAWPAATARSARFRPAARTRIKTCWGPGFGSGTSWTWTPDAVTTAAFMAISPDARFGGGGASEALREPVPGGAGRHVLDPADLREAQLAVEIRRLEGPGVQVDPEARLLARQRRGRRQQPPAEALSAHRLGHPEPVDIDPAPGDLALGTALHRAFGVPRQDPAGAAAQPAIGGTVVGAEAAPHRMPVGGRGPRRDLEGEAARHVPGAHSAFRNQMREWPRGMWSRRPNSV